MVKKKGTDAGRHTGNIPVKNLGFTRLFKNYYFITFLFFAMFVNLPVSTLLPFLPYLIVAVGGETAKLGLLNGCRALVEIPVLLMLRSLRRKFPLPLVVSAAAIVFCIEAFCLTRVNSFFQIILLQAFHGIGGGLMIGAATNYVYSLAPEGLNSTAHAMYISIYSVAAILGNFFGGLIIKGVGIFSYFGIVCGVMIFALIYFYISLLVGIKILKKPIS